MVWFGLVWFGLSKKMKKIWGFLFFIFLGIFGLSKKMKKIFGLDLGLCDGLILGLIEYWLGV